MRRREFITLLGGAAAAWPLAARAQQPAMPVIAFLGSGSSLMVPRLHAFRQGLKDMGYVEGENVAMEARWAQGQFDQLPALAAELVRGGVAVIVTTGLGSALAAKAATTTIPVVFVGADNPVRFGLVASLNRPGGNATGLNLLTSELTAKRLEIVRQLLPGTATVAVIINPNSPEVAPQLADVQSDVQDRNRLPQGARRAPATKATSTLLSRHSPNTGLTRSWSPTMRSSSTVSTTSLRWRHIMPFPPSTTGASTQQLGVSSAMDLTMSTPTVRLASMPAGFSKARSRATCRWCSPQNSSLSST